MDLWLVLGEGVELDVVEVEEVEERVIVATITVDNVELPDV